VFIVLAARTSVCKSVKRRLNNPAKQSRPGKNRTARLDRAWRNAPKFGLAVRFFLTTASQRTSIFACTSVYKHVLITNCDPSTSSVSLCRSIQSSLPINRAKPSPKMCKPGTCTTCRTPTNYYHPYIIPQARLTHPRREILLVGLRLPHPHGHGQNRQGVLVHMYTES